MMFLLRERSTGSCFVVKTRSEVLTGRDTLFICVRTSAETHADNINHHVPSRFRRSTMLCCRRNKATTWALTAVYTNAMNTQTVERKIRVNIPHGILMCVGNIYFANAAPIAKTRMVHPTEPARCTTMRTRQRYLRRVSTPASDIKRNRLLLG